MPWWSVKAQSHVGRQAAVNMYGHLSTWDAQTGRGPQNREVASRGVTGRAGIFKSCMYYLSLEIRRRMVWRS